MKLLVLGLSGFVGRSLKRYLQEHPEISLTLLPDPRVDLRDRNALFDAISSLKPDLVLNLAARSSVHASLADPYDTAMVNVMGVINLLDALEATGFTGRLLQVGSGDQYGLVPEERMPVNEDWPMAPRSPYAASKVAAECFVLERARRGRLDALCTRSFNHSGAGQDDRFFLSAMARQIASISLGRQPPVIKAGDLGVTRDFLHVDDVLSAYLLLLTQGQSGIAYNVCSGVEIPLCHVVDEMLRIAGVVARIDFDPGLARPGEQRRLYGSNELLRRLGWQPRISLTQMLAELLQYWQAKFAIEA